MINDADERKFDGKKLSVICFTKILLKNLIFCEKINLLLFNKIVLTKLLGQVFRQVAICFALQLGL